VHSGQKALRGLLGQDKMSQKFCTLGFALILTWNFLSAEDRLWIGSAESRPGDPEVVVGLFATHDDTVHAFAVALKYDAKALQFIDARFDGPEVATGKVGYEYSRVLNDPERGIVILAVIFDISPPFEARGLPPSPKEPQLIAELLFSVRLKARPGVYALMLRDGLGSPPIDNVFSVHGTSVFPELTNGSITVLNPYRLRVLNSQGAPGGEAVVIVEAEHETPIGGFQLSLRYPSELLSVDTEPLDDPFDEDPNEYVEPDVCAWPITWCGLGLEPYLEDGIESFSAWAQTSVSFSEKAPGAGSGWILVNALFDMAPPFSNLPPGRHRIVKIKFHVSEEAREGELIPVTPVNGAGSPPTSNIFVVPVPEALPLSVRPELSGGVIRIVRGFRRGFINGDHKVDLADVIYSLRYLFADGPPPGCMKAADTNDDGKVDIGDTILLLGYLFRHSNPPDPPFEACGSDPTPDDLTCDHPTGC